MSTTSGLTGPPKPPPRFARQEVAPSTGYPTINVARNVPASVGKSAGLLFLGGAAVMAFGFYRVGTFNVKRRQLKQEKKQIRLAIMPFLQAEEDVKFIQEKANYLKWEAETMKDVEGWKVGENVYKTRSFMAPPTGAPPYDLS